MASQQTITGELRKWHLESGKKHGDCVIGNMYNDIHDIWEDGEEAVIHYKDWIESPNFFLAVTAHGGCIKCMKDEEIVYAPRKNFNNSNNPEKG